MSRLHRVQRRLAITESECMAVLVLSGLLLVGMGFRYMHRNARTVSAGAYAEVDSLLRQGSIQWQEGRVSGVDSSGVDGTPSELSKLAPAMAEIDLNTATALELERLPRIGPKLAARIVAYREAHGPFEHVQDLTRVSGIGDKTLLRLESLVYVGSE